MNHSPRTNHPVGEAMQWVARITAVGIEMVLPGLAGQWLDRQFGTTPTLALSGFALGIAAGLWHLLIMTRRSGTSPGPPNADQSSTSNGAEDDAGDQTDS